MADKKGKSKMIYAIISDIHGNYPALRAVLEDAQRHNAEHFIFLGYYTCADYG